MLTAALTAALAAAALAAGCGQQAPSGRMKVAVTTAPLADFARNVGGDMVEVETLVPPGASPHTYEPTAGQFQFLSDASVLVTNGLGLEAWVSDVIAKVGGKDLVEVKAGDAVPRDRLIRAGDYGGDTDLSGPYDPHVWLDPTLAAYQVDAIAEGFARADPDNSEAYLANAASYKEKLAGLDAELSERTSAFSRKSFVALHPAWTYFARRYGLEQAGVVEELPGKEPSARQIRELLDEIKARGITVVFAEPQFSPQAAEAIASEGGARVLTLDPLGDPDRPDVSTYIRMMRHDTAVMEEGMR
jgi:zinc transport system substrate-binding protein